MHVTFAPKGILQIDDARIVFRNFSGAGSKFNREGDRNFAVVISDREIADAMIKEGWKVRIKPPREEGEDPFMYLPVKVKFGYSGPNVYVMSGPATVKLDEANVGQLDEIDIESVDLDIRPFDTTTPDGTPTRSAYLVSIEVTQKVDRFAARHAKRRAVAEDDVPFEV